MRCIDELHMQYPFAGSRMMRDLLNRQGHHIGRRHTRTLMKKMGIQALYCKPNLSQANQAHRKYPYLLKGLAIQRSNQVWSTDITYIPMAKGFVYLCAVYVFLLVALHQYGASRPLPQHTFSWLKS